MIGQLTAMDEWPRHQDATTFDVVCSDSPNWSDGYYFCLGDEAGRFRLFTAIRLHPNNDVLDGYACAVVGHRQHNVRWSRRLRPRIDDMSVGPLSLEVLEPLQRLRTTCDVNPYGIEFDVEWTGVHHPYLEQYRGRLAGGRVVQSRCNYGQACDVSGTATIAGQTYAIDGPSWAGVRDHSWGIGPTGGPSGPYAAPTPVPGPAPFNLRSWSMFRFPDRVVFFQLHQYGDDSPQIEHHEILRASGQVRSAKNAEITVDQVPDHRRARGARLLLHYDNEPTQELKITVTGSPAYLQGGGYFEGFDDGLGRGVYRGEEHHEGEVWDVSSPSRIGDPTGKVRERRDAWAQTFAVCSIAGIHGQGLGHFECVLAGEVWRG